MKEKQNYGCAYGVAETTGLGARGGRATAPAAAGRAGPRANPGGRRPEKHRAREKGPEMKVSRTAAAGKNLKRNKSERERNAYERG